MHKANERSIRPGQDVSLLGYQHDLSAAAGIIGAGEHLEKILLQVGRLLLCVCGLRQRSEQKSDRERTLIRSDSGFVAL